MIVFDDVTFFYAGTGASRPALGHVTTTVVPGEVLAVVGANGSGKSTFARLADGLLVPRDGRVSVEGMDTRDAARTWDIRALVGMVFQDPDDQIVGTVVEEDVAFGPENLGVPTPELRERVTRALAAVGMAGMERREPHLLSQGQKQRVALAGALAMEPAYLVLDEPTAMLDPAGRAAVLALIDDLAHLHGHGIVHISHDAAGVARADRVLVLEAGSLILDGPPEGLLTDVNLLARAGLSLPPVFELGAALRRRGAAVPALTADAESLVGALWP